MQKEGILVDKTHLFNSVSYNDAVGFSVYAYEGFGVILPVYDITKNKEQYPTIVKAVIGTIALTYITYGWIVYLGFGHEALLKEENSYSTNFIPDGWFKYIVSIYFLVIL